MSEELNDEKINQILEELELEDQEQEHDNYKQEPTKITTKQKDEEFDYVQNAINSNIEDALTLEFPSTIIIAGSTKTGKSELMKNIIYKNYKQFNRIYLLCPFANTDKFYSFIPEKYRIEDPTDGDLTLIYNDCINNKNINTLIIADDCISKLNFERGAASKIISATGRHINLSLIIVMQYLNNISPIIRDNSTYLFVTKLKSRSIKTIYDMTSCFNSEIECKRFLDTTCKDYNVIRFNLTGYNTKEYYVFKNKKSRNYVLKY